MKFKNYSNEDYQAVCDFLIELNREKQNHINWNWARFEWMMKHPEFDKSPVESVGLWMDGERVVGAAIYDMYSGEAFCGVLSEYETLYPEILDYAYRNLKDDNGLGIAICDDNDREIALAKSAGFSLAEQTEKIMSIRLSTALSAHLPDNYSLAELDPTKEPYAFQWLMWQGFDHGTDIAVFERDGDVIPEIPEFRKHFNPYLSIAAKNSDGEYVSYCCLWYSGKTDYAYVEPVCTVPEYRGKGIAKAVIFEALNRASALGAKKAYVISDMEFYRKLGFEEEYRFSFYWKKPLTVNGTQYDIVRLLGKGKGGYSYLSQCDGNDVVVKQIHHEPCDYYTFGNKIEAERNDYERLKKAGIRIPKMLDIDIENERIVKKYIDGKTIFDMVANDETVSDYLPQVREMAEQAKASGLNIDYFPTNFVAQDGLLYYIDYECNSFMEEWSFENWGIKYWSKTPEFEAIKKQG